MMQTRLFGLTTGLVILLTGCGFHLRGIQSIPPWLNCVAVIVEKAHPSLCPQLKNRLESFKIDIADPPSAQYWLTIEHDGFQRQITSISSSTTPRQYQLIYKVCFKLQEKNGKEIIPSNVVFVTRQVTINGDRILGSDQEEAIIKNEMIRDAVTQIINRVSHY